MVAYHHYIRQSTTTIYYYYYNDVNMAALYSSLVAPRNFHMMINSSRIYFFFKQCKDLQIVIYLYFSHTKLYIIPIEKNTKSILLHYGYCWLCPNLSKARSFYQQAPHKYSTYQVGIQIQNSKLEFSDLDTQYIYHDFMDLDSRFWTSNICEIYFYELMMLHQYLIPT